MRHRPRPPSQSMTACYQAPSGEIRYRRPARWCKRERSRFKKLLVTSWFAPADARLEDRTQEPGTSSPSPQRKFETGQHSATVGTARRGDVATSPATGGVAAKEVAPNPIDPGVRIGQVHRPLAARAVGPGTPIVSAPKPDRAARSPQRWRAGGAASDLRVTVSFERSLPAMTGGLPRSSRSRSQRG